MFFIIYNLLNHKMLPCFSKEPGVKAKKLNGAARLEVASIVFDAFISITALVMGILGIVSVLPGMPPAASYTLIPLGGLIALIWLGVGAISRGQLFKDAAGRLRAALSSDPKWA